MQKAIELLKANEPKTGYLGCFSGGKDSIVVKELAKMAAVRVEWHYHKTTIDPPELLSFMKKHHQDVIWDRPRFGNFFNRMAKKGFPTRRFRWCCEEYKESPNYGPGDVLIMGIRAEESPARAKKWGEITNHQRSGAKVICPIFDWAADELWHFIRSHKIPYCELYDRGFKRLGCIGCPQAARHRKKEFAHWPQYEKKWKRAFQLIWERRAGTKQRDGREWFGSAHFDNWEQMWFWWLNETRLPDKRQLKLTWGAENEQICKP